MAAKCPFISTEGALDVACVSGCMFYGGGNAGTCKLIASTGTVPVSSSTFATSAKQDTLNNTVATAAKQDTLNNAVATAAKQDTLNNAVGYTGAAADTLKAAVGYTGTAPDTLKDWSNGIVGAIADRDTGDVSLYAYLKDVFGKNSEKDDSQSLYTYLKTLFGIKSERDNTNSFINYLKDILGIHTDKIETDQTVLMLNKHDHDSHLHAFPHAGVTVPTTIGSDTSSAITPPKAASLIAEYMGNQDLDGNGAIYGYDFMIIGTDPEKPNMLKSIEGMSTWTDPASKITWAAYLIWVG